MFEKENRMEGNMVADLVRKEETLSGMVGRVSEMGERFIDTDVG